ASCSAYTAEQLAAPPKRKTTKRFSRDNGLSYSLRFCAQRLGSTSGLSLAKGEDAKEESVLTALHVSVSTIGGALRDVSRKTGAPMGRWLQTIRWKKLLRFRLRSLLVLIAFAGVLLGWWSDHRRMEERIQRKSDLLDVLRTTARRHFEEEDWMVE